MNPCTYEDAGPNGEAPGHVPQAVVGRVERKGGNVVGIDAVADETARRVGVQANHEEERLQSVEALGAHEPRKSRV